MDGSRVDRQQKAKEAEALDRELSSYRKAVKNLEAENRNKVDYLDIHIYFYLHNI